MIKKSTLDENHILITTAHYPYYRSEKRRREHKALIGIGGNIGDVIRRFEHLFWFLKRSRHVTLLKSAPILRNPPFGFLNQADFYNSMLLLSTPMSPRELLRYLLHTEKRFGRKRFNKDGPRTLDLDIIFYDDIQIDSKMLKIPHPDWMNRNSVLIPMKYMKGRR
ncbi:MAG: 2-amino-4-hydroxy-6-hydroxymethyldihydropteridine diphosphokinase [Epsilonproteobacteria bacterium]|nr:MAG: 2-amino-4-hydroxy-6-hydroxymethyldihydropteridine diphosphokinase [Campylobacterota bacterium]